MLCSLQAEEAAEADSAALAAAPVVAQAGAAAAPEAAVPTFDCKYISIARQLFSCLAFCDIVGGLQFSEREPARLEVGV